MRFGATEHFAETTLSRKKVSQSSPSGVYNLYDGCLPSCRCPRTFLNAAVYLAKIRDVKVRGDGGLASGQFGNVLFKDQ